jgi:hypothetical protein
VVVEWILDLIPHGIFPVLAAGRDTEFRRQVVQGAANYRTAPRELEAIAKTTFVVHAHFAITAHRSAHITGSDTALRLACQQNRWISHLLAEILTIWPNCAPSPLEYPLGPAV